MTVGGTETNYQLSQYDYLSVNSSSSALSVTLDDDTTTGGIAGNVSWGLMAVGNKAFTLDATGFDHENFNGSTSNPTADTAGFHGTVMGDVFSAQVGNTAYGTTLTLATLQAQNGVYTNTVTDATAIVHYQSGTSTASFTDNYGNVTLTTNPSTGTTLTNNATSQTLVSMTTGFTGFTATSSVPNNTDVANLYDAAGSYTFKATGGATTASNSATLAPADGGSGYSYGVSKFQTINAYSVGADTAVLTDTAGYDAFVGTPTSSSIGNGSFYKDTAYYFCNVVASSATGGQSTAKFEDSGASAPAVYDSTTHTLDLAGVDIAASGFSNYSTSFTANDAPVLNPSNFSLASIAENPTSNPGELVSALIGGQQGGVITDADGDNLLGIAVTAVDDSNGTWQYNGGPNGWEDMNLDSSGNSSPVSAGNARLLLAANNTMIRFVPNSTTFAGTASITFAAWDSTSTDANTLYTAAGAYSQSSATATITVTSPVSLSSNALPSTYTDGSSPIVVFPSVTISDSSTTTLTAATLAIAGNFLSGDTLTFNNQNP